jgi:hypothetical protein
MYETEDSSIFYVYPPSTGGSYIYTKQSVFPADLTTTVQTVGLDEAFQQALIYYCCYKAFLQDTDQVNQQKASTFATLFSNQLAGNDQAEQREDQKNAS